MGTRSLTVFEDEGKAVSGDEGKEIVVMYRQMDGYPKGHGQDLCQFLTGITLVNGIPMGNEKRLANGMGCLAAQVVAHFKNGVGEIYLHPAGTRGVDEEYRYHVSGREGGEPNVKVIEVSYHAPDKTLYDGPASEFNVESPTTGPVALSGTGPRRGLFCSNERGDKSEITQYLEA